MRVSIALAVLVVAANGWRAARADVALPAIFTDHMVLQRGQANRIWGWAEAGEEIEVSVADQSHSTTAGDDGNWQVTLEELPVGGPYEVTVQGANRLEISDVLVGEVWLCSGQSNMEWPVAAADDARLERLAADYPQIRLITVPKSPSQKPVKDFDGRWEKCSPETVGTFSAVGYSYGRALHQILGVPIGLIDNSWGGSSCEAWIRRDVLEEEPRFDKLMARWVQVESSYDHQQEVTQYEQALQQWQDEGRQGNRPRQPRNPLQGNHRPANLYNGQLTPILGYGIRGVIWYQGESNAGRAYQYRDLFPLMIETWRNDWELGDFPFYWVQLADYMEEVEQAGDSDWAELREAQTMTLDKLPNTGQAVITDSGEAHDIHPRDKRTVALRLARWALAKDYGKQVTYRSPRYKSLEIEGSKAVVTFDIGDRPAAELDTFDVNRLIGFAIAGEDRKFVGAQAEIVAGDQVEVWSDDVPHPVAVRYAWADNPVCNLQNKAGLPATPFRTDDWPGATEGKE